MAVCLLFMCVTMVNHFYSITAPLLYALGAVMPVNLVVGVLGINQKWKMLLFAFLVSYYLPLRLEAFQKIVVMVSSALTCFYAYDSLVFATPLENLWYFAGFFTVLCVYLYKYVMQEAFSL